MKYLLFLFLFIPNIIFSQSICGTDEYNKPLIENNPKQYESIERAIQNYINGSRFKTTGKIVIPVVFHIIWQDDNENLADSVIHHQVEVLNEAFNATNSDTSILTDTLKNWVGNFEISFELAYLDPEGNPTTGITRRKTQAPHFSYWGNYMKFDSTNGTNAWPTDKYLNFWVCDLYGGLLGYAQFPGGPSETDGLVLDWQITGNQIYPWTYPNLESFAGGRVAVHEVGHWLNLFHPWGNNGQCSEDHIPETGKQEGPVYPSAQCPDTLISNCEPAERVFVKHYMDYCGNACMVCFTKSQVERGMASLMTNRLSIIENYIPRPTVNTFDETKINPTLTKGRLYFEFPEYEGRLDIEIYDIMGRSVWSTNLWGERYYELFLGKNVNGTYIIQLIYNKKSVFSKKIVINSNSPYGSEIYNKNEIKKIKKK